MTPRCRPAGRPPLSHWTDAAAQIFSPLYRTKSGRRVDINERLRESVDRAVVAAGGPRALPGKIIAELMFGFWRYLSSAGHEKTLWVPCLNKAFPQGTDRRRDVDVRMGRLHQLRNRVAHHESLLNINICDRLQDLLELSLLLDRQLGDYVAATTNVGVILARRP
jgi:hypothetical protein